MPKEEKLAKALFKTKGKKAFSFDVQFNPQSLKYNVTNTLKPGRKKNITQHVTRTTAKLAMELIFDSTHSGIDVREQTLNIARLMEPNVSTKKIKNKETKKTKTKTKRAPPVVTFSWGDYSFEGILDSFNETIDFFAPNGTPLRSTVSISLTSHEVDFKPDINSPFDVENNNSKSTFANSARGVQQVAAKLGDPSAARDIAKANNIEDPRHPGKQTIEIGPSLPGNTGTKIPGGGAPLSSNNGNITGGGAPLPGKNENITGGGASLPRNSENITAGAIGAKLSAGVSATGGAFAGLRNIPSSPIRELDIDNLVSDSATVGLDLQTSASVGLGGQASVSTGASATFQVGEAGDLKKTLEFDSDLL